MNGSGASSSGRLPPLEGGKLRSAGLPAGRIGGLLVLIGCLLFVGCAARRGAGSGRVVPVEPAAELEMEREAPASPASALPLLPGTERVYPSEDPRNRPADGAPPAFPADGRGPAPVESVSRPPSEPLAGGQPEAPPAAPVEATPDSRPATSESGFAVQLFASTSKSAAEGRLRQAGRSFDCPLRIVAGGGYHRVRLGPVPSREEAEALRRRAVDLGYRDAFLVPVPATGGGGS